LRIAMNTIKEIHHMPDWIRVGSFEMHRTNGTQERFEIWAHTENGQSILGTFNADDSLQNVLRSVFEAVEDGIKFAYESGADSWSDEFGETPTETVKALKEEHAEEVEAVEAVEETVTDLERDHKIALQEAADNACDRAAESFTGDSYREGYNQCKTDALEAFPVDDAWDAQVYI